MSLNKATKELLVLLQNMNNLWARDDSEKSTLTKQIKIFPFQIDFEIKKIYNLS